MIIHLKIFYINIIFHDFETGKEVNIQFSKNEKIRNLIESFKIKTSNLSKYIRFSYNLKEIDELDKFMWNIIKDMTLAEFGLKDNSIVYYTKYHIIYYIFIS